jgi:hypothetical protein
MINSSASPILKKKRNRTLLALVFIVLCFDLLLRSFSYSSPNSDLSSQIGISSRSSSLYFKEFFNNKPIYMIGDEAAYESFSHESHGYSLQLNKLLYPHNELLNRGAIGFNCTMWSTHSVALLHNLKNAGLVIMNFGTE